MTKIAPSLLAADFAKLHEEVKDIEQGGADWLHLDVMDGHFVPNISFGPGVIKSLKKHSNLFFDVHLMIENPEAYIDAFVDAGADMITVHAEACVHLDRVIDQIIEAGVKVGVALNPHTPIDVLEYVLHNLDLVLVMTVNPGFGGQQFNPVMIEKVRDLNDWRGNVGYNFEIQVDGGVNAENASELIDAGVDVLVAGTTVFGEQDRAAAIKALRGE